MQLQLSIFLYIYLAFVVFWLIFNLIVIFHMLKYGIKSAATYAATFIFIGVSVLIMYFSYGFISVIDWNTEIPLFEGASSYGQEAWN